MRNTILLLALFCLLALVPVDGIHAADNGATMRDLPSGTSGLEGSIPGSQIRLFAPLQSCPPNQQDNTRTRRSRQFRTNQAETQRLLPRVDRHKRIDIIKHSLCSMFRTCPDETGSF